MPSPLFDAMNPEGLQMSGPMGMIQEFQKFRQSYRGDAQQDVQNLLNTGKMTQQQYNELQSMAHRLQMMMGR